MGVLGHAPREQGQKVYTIGNPSSLRHTVTSGIISGYREYKDNPLIQTDAPINPGNSGALSLMKTAGRSESTP
ncbi:MAG: trypsin-like peptidase domain-containing protein [Thermodesulfobacteriota bacterium]|nr:trypsin-like peptidase domain-containing protein [Thermodesulfobacteriota bacterium]